jgi:hypothetical protein
MENEKFNKNKCLDTINNLKQFYEKDKFKNDHGNYKEISHIKNIISTCFKEKCPPGYYYLHGECLYG